MSLAEITRAAKGTIENNYTDGVFTESKISAARMARTIVNGVSNNARVETIVQNSDAIDGVKFVGTLDGKTCPYCASYDGYIWRGEEIAEARRPPIHPNCRCCLIPYVELKDEEGNVVDVDGERPAANADFDKLAQDAYNERAREKGWKRRWDDLSPSTRLKYYYQAQKDFEAETGKPAYRQVSGATTFQEYFHRQPDSFKRAWLGAKRYDLYKAGKLKEKNIFKPDLTYQVSVESLNKLTTLLKRNERDKGDIYGISEKRLFRDFLRRLSSSFFSKEPTLPEPIKYDLKARRKLQKKLFRRAMEFKSIIDTPMESLVDAEKQIGNIGIKANYSNTKKEVETHFVNTVNTEISRFFLSFGDIGTVREISFVEDLAGFDALYEEGPLRISFLNQPFSKLEAKIERANKIGYWKSSSVGGIIWHELGHAYSNYLKETDVNAFVRFNYIERLAEIFEKHGNWKRSDYCASDINELIAEIMAEKHDNPKGKEVNYLLRILTQDSFTEVFKEAKNGLI